MNQAILTYLKKMKVFSLATSENNIPYSANCYYAFDENTISLLFLSDTKTRHIKEAIKNLNVAGTISSTAKTVATIKGVQLTGKFIVPTTNEKEKFYAIYYKRFPFAKLKPAPIWGVKVDYIKMTDNTLGFGTKLMWEKE